MFLILCVFFLTECIRIMTCAQQQQKHFLSKISLLLCASPFLQRSNCYQHNFNIWDYPCSIVCEKFEDTNWLVRSRNLKKHHAVNQRLSNKNHTKTRNSNLQLELLSSFCINIYIRNKCFFLLITLTKNDIMFCTNLFDLQ